MKKSDKSEKVDKVNDVLEIYKYVAKIFLEKYGGIISGSAALAFFIKSFVPDDIDVFYDDEEAYIRAKKETDVNNVQYHQGYDDIEQIEVSYNLFMNVKFNLVYVKFGARQRIATFDIECCKVIWNPFKENPFSESCISAIEAVTTKNTDVSFCELIKNSSRFTSRVRKYIKRGI